jgi:hypothetical protein
VLSKAWIVRLLALVVVGAALGVGGASLAVGQDAPDGPAGQAEAPVQPGPPNPCLTEQAQGLRCPDLMMRRPFGLRVERTKAGRVRLRAGNSIDSVGKGPAALRGERTSSRWMEADQLIQRRDGGNLRVKTAARLQFKLAHLGRRYWKFHDAARFQLWGLDAEGNRTQVVRTGPKVAYCLRDLERTRPSLPRTPRRPVYPPCSTNAKQRRVTLGTSVGWSDVYPPQYPEQFIDVTGLQGCFAYVHTADPDDVIRELDEGNNESQVIVRLPFRRDAQRGPCPGRQFGVTYRKTGTMVDPW